MPRRRYPAGVFTCERTRRSTGSELRNPLRHLPVLERNKQARICCRLQSGPGFLAALEFRLASDLKLAELRICVGVTEINLLVLLVETARSRLRFAFRRPVRTIQVPR